MLRYDYDNIATYCHIEMYLVYRNIYVPLSFEWVTYFKFLSNFREGRETHVPIGTYMFPYPSKGYIF